jgi:hypothetical protein
MKLNALGEGAEFFSPWLNKNSSLNALKENKRIRRIRGMKLSAFNSINHLTQQSFFSIRTHRGAWAQSPACDSR